MINERPSDPMTPRAAGCLLLGLEELDALTEAPLRLRAHASAAGHEVFHVQEVIDRNDFHVVPLCGGPEDQPSYSPESVNPYS